MKNSKLLDIQLEGLAISAAQYILSSVLEELQKSSFLNKEKFDSDNAAKDAVDYFHYKRKMEKKIEAELRYFLMTYLQCLTEKNRQAYIEAQRELPKENNGGSINEKKDTY